MNYEVKKKGAFTVAGKKITVRPGEDEKSLLPNFWGRAMKESWYKELYTIGKPGAGTMGVCSSVSDDGTFDYYIAIEKPDGESANAFETLEIPASEWACFESVGPMPHAIQDVWKYVMTEWLPSSGYRHAGTPDLEVYTNGDNSAQDYKSYVWIPVVKE